MLVFVTTMPIAPTVTGRSYANVKKDMMAMEEKTAQVLSITFVNHKKNINFIHHHQQQNVMVVLNAGKLSRRDFAVDQSAHLGKNSLVSCLHHRSQPTRMQKTRDY